MLQRIDGTRDVVEVSDRRVAVLARFGIDHVDGSPGRAEMHLPPPGLEVMPRVLSV